MVLPVTFDQTTIKKIMKMTEIMKDMMVVIAIKVNRVFGVTMIDFVCL